MQGDSGMNEIFRDKLAKLKANSAFKSQLTKVLSSVDDGDRGAPVSKTLIKRDLDHQVLSMRYKREEIVNQVAAVLAVQSFENRLTT